MAEKTWGGEPFWGLGYEWDPDWFLTERQKELRAKLIELCEQEMRANAKRSDDELLYPRRNFEILARERLPRAHRARGVRRARREPRRVHDGLRDARPLRLRLHGHVLRHAHRRGRDDHAAPHPRADRQVHPPAEALQDRHAVLLRPRDRLALLVPVLLQGRALERRLQGQQEGVLDDLRRLRRLLRRADHQPGLQGLRRPVGVRDRRRATSRPSRRCGTRSGCAATSPARSRSRTSRSPPTRSSARSATAPPRTTRPSTPGS